VLLPHETVPGLAGDLRCPLHRQPQPWCQRQPFKAVLHQNGIIARNHCLVQLTRSTVLKRVYNDDMAKRRDPQKEPVRTDEDVREEIRASLKCVREGLVADPIPS
jgi:hypothetical protein